jgi:hypothetical protein
MHSGLFSALITKTAGFRGSFAFHDKRKDRLYGTGTNFWMRLPPVTSPV